MLSVFILLFLVICVILGVRIFIPHSSSKIPQNKRVIPTPAAYRLGKRQLMLFFSFASPMSWQEKISNAQITLTSFGQLHAALVIPKTVNSKTNETITTLSQVALKGQTPIFLKVISVDGHLGIEQMRITTEGVRIEAFISDVKTPTQTGIQHIFIDIPHPADESVYRKMFDSVLQSIRYLSS